VIFNTRDTLTALAIVVGVYLGILAASCGTDNRPESRGLDSLALPVATVAVDFDLGENVFTLGEVRTTIITDNTDLRAWLTAHQGRRIVLSVREWRGVK